MIVITSLIVGAQQFITKKDFSKKQPVQPKELLYDLINLEKRVPDLLYKTADLLRMLHVHIEACVDGDKRACTKTKDVLRCESYKNAIVEVNNTIDKLELTISRFVDFLKLDGTICTMRDNNTA